MNPRKKIYLLSNIAFGIALITTAYVLVNSYIIQKDLPPGVCPLNDSRSIIYFGIGMCVVSLIFSFLGEEK